MAKKKGLFTLVKRLFFSDSQSKEEKVSNSTLFIFFIGFKIIVFSFFLSSFFFLFSFFLEGEEKEMGVCKASDQKICLDNRTTAAAVASTAVATATTTASDRKQNTRWGGREKTEQPCSNRGHCLSRCCGSCCCGRTCCCGGRSPHRHSSVHTHCLRRCREAIRRWNSGRGGPYVEISRNPRICCC